MLLMSSSAVFNFFALYLLRLRRKEQGITVSLKTKPTKQTRKPKTQQKAQLL